MREIEYKAKMVDGGVWVYGYYCELAGRKYIIPDYSQFRDIHDADLESSFTEIIPETVCQWTGLTDKNGGRLYKGDIFVYQKHDNYLIDSFIGAVKFKDGCYGYSVYFKYVKNEKTFTPFSKFDELQEDFLDHIEIIGNIHDKAHPKQAIINMIRLDEELGMYDCGNGQ